MPCLDVSTTACIYKSTDKVVCCPWLSMGRELVNKLNLGTETQRRDHYAQSRDLAAGLTSMISPCCRSSSFTLLFACKVDSHISQTTRVRFHQLFHPALGSLSPEIIYFRATVHTQPLSKPSPSLFEGSLLIISTWERSAELLVVLMTKAPVARRLTELT
ncbi:hypothetical protein BDV27DRAFT_120979 [Aspergillus caelatus]|uniref:Uncharacterized protein n=1 Tax=Aspergillus caelatus TaxID=61420 RepID=A0A5N7AHS4_9EURO|nr:uncharacterized protein BDV27DRAFT_120979 [Aspergillus caelatus]KAE8369437.1 hypothetical protein BDV27DRAFT_120979 [Aspergillus caelatus]